MGRLEFRDGLASKGMPITHGHKTACVQPAPGQLRLESPRLTLSKAADGRAAANGRIMVLHFTGARGRNQFGQRLAADAGKGEVNDIGVTEEVIKERLDRSQRVRTAELKQNHPHTP